MSQEMFNFLLLYIVGVSIAALVALAIGIVADQRCTAAQHKAAEWRELYFKEKENREKLISENSILRLYSDSLEDAVLTTEGVRHNARNNNTFLPRMR